MKTEEYMNGWDDAIIEVNKVIENHLSIYNHGKTMFAKHKTEEYIDIPDYKISALTKLQDLVNKLTYE